MKVIPSFLRILGLVILAVGIFVVLGILFPRSTDSRAAGWILYGAGCVLILLAYLRRRRGTRNPDELEERSGNSIEVSQTGRVDPEGNMEQVRERIRLRKSRKDCSGNE